jgi:hypothetical protein
MTDFYRCPHCTNLMRGDELQAQLNAQLASSGLADPEVRKSLWKALFQVAFLIVVVGSLLGPLLMKACGR